MAAKSKNYDLDVVSYSSHYIVVIGKDAHKFRKPLEEIGGSYSELIKDAPNGTGWIFPTSKQEEAVSLVKRILKGEMKEQSEVKSNTITLQDFINLSNRVNELENLVQSMISSQKP